MLNDSRYRLQTVRHVLEYYMENKGFSAESWRDLANMTYVFITVMGKKKLQDLQPEHFAAYCNARRRGAFGKRPARSKGTLSRELRHLQTAIKFCIKAKVLNPEHAPFIPMPEEPPPRSRWLTKDEIQKIKSALVPNSRLDTFVRIALATGARKQSIQSLEWSQVNFSTNMITFQKPNQRKTKKKKPTLPMQGDLRVYLENLHHVSQTPYVMITTTPINAPLKTLGKKLSIDGLTPHVLRHTWATHASMNGVALNEIARILGDSIVTVEKVYAKFQPGYLKNAIEIAAL